MYSHVGLFKRSFCVRFPFLNSQKIQNPYREDTENSNAQLDVILGEIIFCVWTCLCSP